jgi:hypothetical protein
MATMVLLLFRASISTPDQAAHQVHAALVRRGRTQAPVVVLALIRAFMVIYPLFRMSADMVLLEGTIDTGCKSVTVLVVTDPAYEHTQRAPGDFHIKIPSLLFGTLAARVKDQRDRA